MNTRIRVASFVSALALSVTVSAGVATAQTTSSAELLPSANPLGCTVSAGAGSSVDFGDFTWNGATYTGTTTPGSVNLTVQTDEAPGTRDCPAVMVYGTDLTRSSITSFPVSAISVGSVTSLGSATSGQQVIAANPAVPLTGSTTPLTVDLEESAVVNTAPIGVYTGTITFTIGNGL